MPLSNRNNDIFLISDPKILEIPIVDNNEAMINLVHQDDIICGPSPEIPNNTDYTYMRESVFAKLNEAQTLLPQGLRFCLYEAYRSLKLQKLLFDTRYAKIKKTHAEWTHTEVFNETIKLIAPVVNLDGSMNIPPHSTGGAIDVYLLDTANNPIDMGIHPQDWMNDTDGSLSLTDSTCISLEAQKNRKIMSAVLSAVGFVNYPTEYWHWSYGDRYWAVHKKESYAIYNSYKF